MPGTALLIGDATIEATTVANAAEKIKYHKFQCEKTGTLETVELYILEALASEPELGIFVNTSGKPGVLSQAILHAKTVLVKEEWLPFTGFSVSVVAGTSYWFGFVDSVEVKYKSLTGTVKNTEKGTAAKKTLTSTPAVEAEATPEKISLKGLGTELLTAKCTSKFELRDSVNAVQTLATKPSSRFEFKDSVNVLQTTAAKCLAKLELKDQVIVAQLLRASPTSKVILGVGITPAQAQQAVGSSRLVFQSTFQATFKTEGGGRVSIFIFEE